MKVEYKTIKTEHKEAVYVSEDGMEFRHERDCILHDLEISQGKLKKRNDIIRCEDADDWSPFNGECNYEYHKYLWYKPLTYEAVEALLAAYPPAYGSLDERCIGKWCCVECAEGEYFLTSIDDDMKYVKNLCRLLGIEVTFREEEDE